MSDAPGSAEHAREKVQDVVQDVAEQAQEKVSQVTDEAHGMVRKQVDQRTSDLGEQVTSTSEDLRNISEKLRDEGQDTPAQLADKAAEQTNRVGRYLADADTDTLIADFEDLGRRQPLLVLAGGVVLGIAAARFLKASSSRRFDQRSGNTGSPQVSSGIPATRTVTGPGNFTPVPTTQRPAATTQPTAVDPVVPAGPAIR